MESLLHRSIKLSILYWGLAYNWRLKRFLPPIPPRIFPFQCPIPPNSAAVSTKCCPVQNPAPPPFPTLPRPLPTGELLELGQERLEEVIVDLVGGGVVPDVEEIVH